MPAISLMLFFAVLTDYIHLGNWHLLLMTRENIQLEHKGIDMIQTAKRDNKTVSSIV